MHQSHTKTLIMWYLEADIIITQSAHLDIFLACWESESKRRIFQSLRIGPPANDFFMYALRDDKDQ